MSSVAVTLSITIPIKLIKRAKAYGKVTAGKKFGDDKHDFSKYGWPLNPSTENPSVQYPGILKRLLIFKLRISSVIVPRFSSRIPCKTIFSLHFTRSCFVVFYVSSEQARN